ncbi:MAG: TonB-dependent receptor [Acidobacteria bacterium]|nr:TonB-dependent receptor [Acidobacteriota bacterium]
MTVRNTEQNTALRTETNELGNYEAHNLVPGQYEVTVEAASFKKFVHGGVTLNATQVVRIDAALEVGTTQSEVTVSEGSPVIATETATIDDARTNREILALPLNFRAANTSVIGVIALAPGVQVRGGADNFSIAGSRLSQNETSIDGISTLGMRNHDVLVNMFPSAESVREMRISSVSNGAEYQGAANVDTISRSGENSFHGSLFEYHQNGAFDARNLFSTSVPFKVANTFGGSLGGPVMLPRLYDGHNRTFFFMDYEANRRASQAVLSPTVPTEALRRGDFSQVRGLTLRDLDGAPFPGNQIPRSRQNATSLGLGNFYPLPNFGPPDLLSANFRGAFPASIKSDQFDIRLDHHVSSRHFLFTRFSFKNLKNGSVSFTLPTIGPSRETPHVRTYVLSDSFTLSPRLVNEFRVGFARQWRRIEGPFHGPTIIRQLGIQGLHPDLPDRPGFPQISISGFTTLSQATFDNEFSGSGEFQEHMTYIRGAHTMKWGASVRLLRVTNITNVSGAGMFGNFTFQNSFTGNAYGDFLLGLPTTTQRIVARRRAEGFTRNWNFFWQDDWKVSPRLTFNYGLRYEYHPPFRDRFGNISTFDPITGRVIVPTKGLANTEPVFRATIGDTPIVSAQEAGLPESLRRQDLNNFAPRLGIAFRPFRDNRTVIRGGYGVFINDLIGAVFGSLRNIHTASTETFTNRVTNAVPFLQFPRAFPDQIITGVADFRTANQIDMPNPYTLQWHLTVEREVMRNTGVRLSYIGSRSLKIVHQVDYNQPRASTVPFTKSQAPFPLWNTIFSRVNGQTAKYHAFQGEFDRRLAAGLTLQSSYSWTRNWSDAGDSNETGSLIEDSFDRRREYSNVEFARPHKWLTVWIWELPLGRNRRYLSHLPAAVEQVLGGWEFSGILLFQSGYWFHPVFTGYDPSNTNGTSRSGSFRPDRVADGNLPPAERSMTRWFDAAAFVPPPRNAGRFGNAAPYILAGPGMSVWSASLGKGFHLGEQRRLRLMGSFQNLLNHPNLSNPATNISTPGSVGRITSTLGTEGAGSRTVELSARLEF